MTRNNRRNSTTETNFVVRTSSVLVIDTASRGLNAYMASVTVCENGGLVLRKAFELGEFSEIIGEFGFVAETPVLVTTTGYSAQSSAGFVSLLGFDRYENGHRLASKTIVGGAGFGHEMWLDGVRKEVGGGLRAFSHTIGAYILPEGTEIVGLKTHSNSNSDTAGAAYVGLELASRKNPIIAQGQSDYTSGIQLRLPENARKFVFEFSAEHRGELFTEEKIAQAHVLANIRKEIRNRVDKVLTAAEMRAEMYFEYARQETQCKSDASYFGAGEADFLVLRQYVAEAKEMEGFVIRASFSDQGRYEYYSAWAEGHGASSVKYVVDEDFILFGRLSPEEDEPYYAPADNDQNTLRRELVALARRQADKPIALQAIHVGIMAELNIWAHNKSVPGLVDSFEPGSDRLGDALLALRDWYLQNGYRFIGVRQGGEVPNPEHDWIAVKPVAPSGLEGVESLFAYEEENFAFFRLTESNLGEARIVA